MLLNELKLIFETDRQALQGALANLGVSMASKSSAKPTGDAPKSLAPIVAKYVLSLDKSASVSESELKKIFNTPEKLNEAYDGFVSIYEIVKKIDEDLVSGLISLTEAKRLALNDPKYKASDINQWITLMKKDIDNLASVDKVKEEAQDALSKNRPLLTDTVMNIRTSQTWAANRIKLFEEYLKVSPPNDEQLRTAIQATLVILDALLENSDKLAKLIATARNSSPKT
jgi:hypothetical protein